MQLWLKEGIGREIAMNKPPEDEIWPNTSVEDRRKWPNKLPRGMYHEVADHTVVWRLEKLDGCRMRIELPHESHPMQYLGSVAIEFLDIIERRTHCPRCGEKVTGTAFLHADYGGHEAFTCPANDEWDSRFPRDW